SAPPAPPLIGRLRGHPQPLGHLYRLDSLLVQLGGLKPHPFALDPSPAGQAATIRVPHTTGIALPAAEITAPRRTMIRPRQFNLCSRESTRSGLLPHAAPRDRDRDRRRAG